MWADNETELDAINVQHVVGAVVDILTAEHLTPVTVGVFGPWGVGKSSVAKMVERALTPPEGQEKDSDTLVVYFNGWRFEGYEDAKAALAATILEALEARVRLVPELWEMAKHEFREFWGRVNWLRVGKTALAAGLAVKTGGLSLLLTRGAGLLGGTSGADAEGEEEKDGGDGWLKERAEEEGALHATIRDFDAAFKKLLDQSKVRRLVVVIDDLDRCLPDRVIDTLEAIRLFLAVKGTAFVITADELLVQHAVKARFPGMEALRAQVGQDYLEKMIQIPVRLPLLGRADLENYLNLLFAQRRLAPDRFTKLCRDLVPPATAGPTAAASGPGLGVAFGLDSSAGLLGAEYTAALRDDLALAQQIVHVVALSVEGNPRQVKRYLNALVLRLSIATKRGVVIAPPLAAKLMLLEYFRTEAFLQLARWQAAQGGRPREITLLERARTGARAEAAAGTDAAPVDGAPVGVPASRDGKAPAATAAAPPAVAMSHQSNGTSARPGRGGAGTAAGAAAAGTAHSPEPATVPEPPLGPEGAAWLQDEWLQAWLATEPLLTDVDLGPYFYFARDRFVAQAVSTQQLGPLGEAVFAGLCEASEAARLAVRERARGLATPVAFAVLGALAARARLTGKPDAGDDSPYAGVYDLCGWRPEVAAEVVRFFGAQPVSVFRAATPARLLAATANGPGGAAARAQVGRWAAQSDNPTLAASATRALRSPAGTGAPSGVVVGARASA